MNTPTIFVRLFVAIDVPQNVKDEVARVQDELRAQNVCQARFTQPEGIHITLKFMGDIPTGQISVIKLALDTIEVKKMTIFLDRLDVFMRGPIVKIILMRINSVYIAELARQIERCLLPWVAAESRDFVPHITLARVKHVPDLPALAQCIAETRIKSVPFVADSFVLKQSELTIEGPIYTDIARFDLVD